MYNFGRAFVLILLLSSCTQSGEVEIYRGTDRNAKKLLTIFNSRQLPVRISSVTGTSVLFVDGSEIDSSEALVKSVMPYFGQDVSPQDKGIKDFFLPKKIDDHLKITNATLLDKIFTELDSSRFVLKVEKSYFSAGGLELNVICFESLEVKSEIGKLIGILQEKYDLSSQNIRIKIEAVSLGSLSSIPEQWKSTLTVLEPFSFHVLKSEKALAGIQFLLLLLLFLLSGFILGVWWRGREK